jgi:hypothetical protein
MLNLSFKDIRNYIINKLKLNFHTICFYWLALKIKHSAVDPHESSLSSASAVEKILSLLSVGI